MKKVMLDGALYFRAIRNLRNCVSTDINRPVLRKIMFAVKGNHIHFSALDGYQGQKITLPLLDDSVEVEDFEGVIDPTVPVANPSRKKISYPVTLELIENLLHISYLEDNYRTSYVVSQNTERSTALENVLESHQTIKEIAFSTRLLLKALKACKGSDTIRIHFPENPTSPIKLTGQYGETSTATFAAVVLPIRG